MDEPIIKQAGFQPQHPRFSGRRRKTTRRALEIVERLGIDPLEFMAQLLATGTYDEVTVGERGKVTRTKKAVPLDVLVDIAKTFAQYIHPRLSAVAVSGHGGGPIETTTSTITAAAILMNPELSEAMQKIAFAAAEVDAAQPRAIDAPYSTEPNE